MGLALLLVGFLPPRETPPGVAYSALAANSADAALPEEPRSAGSESHAEREVDPRAVPVPTRLDIPRIGVHTDVIPVGLNADGTVTVPPGDPRAPAAWYRYGASPGEPGPAVLLGHVDSYRGPAVFYRLADLVPGDRISIGRADGHTVVFAVHSVENYPKTSFPTDAVYGPTDSPVLRLITCGGDFDRVHRTYLSNVVVYADLAS
jgi:sortase (surface protein transpeptidase)